MRFIFLTLGYHPDLVGGAYRYVAEVAERLAARGREVDVICPNPGNKFPARELRAGVTLHRVAKESGFFWVNWRRENTAARLRLENLLAARPAALPVLCHAFFEPATAGCSGPLAFLFTGPWAEEFLLARQARPRSMVRQKFDGLIATRLRAAENRALRRSRRILTISRYYEQQLPRWHGAGLPSARIISGGVNASQFSPPSNRVAARGQLGLLEKDFLFLAVRRLDPRMGLLTLLEGFAAVAREFPSARLWLAGQGPQRARLEARIAELQLGDRVRLLGFVPEADLPRLLGAADCTLMPSLDLEGFGLATAESLACGTPVLASRAGANPELLAPLGEHLLFEAGSTDSLAAKLRDVLRSPELLPRRATCREYALRHFSWDKVAQACEETFTELLPVGE